MTFKEFVDWCNEHACDGCWSMATAQCCIAIINEVRTAPFWRRKKQWREYEEMIAAEIVGPINSKIRELQEATTDD